LVYTTPTFTPHVQELSIIANTVEFGLAEIGVYCIAYDLQCA
jgi:hypothetical protein